MKPGQYNDAKERSTAVVLIQFQFAASVEQRLKKRGAHLKLKLGHYPYLDYEALAFCGNNGKFKLILEI